MPETANIHGTDGDNLTVVLPDWSADIRGLIALRVKYGPESAIGHRCSNIVELLKAPDLASYQIQQQMRDLEKLLKAAP